MREICTSGSMSREWKRTVWQAPQARRTTPRHFLTLPELSIAGMERLHPSDRDIPQNAVFSSKCPSTSARLIHKVRNFLSASNCNWSLLCREPGWLLLP